MPLTDSDLAFVDLPTATEIATTGAIEGPAVTLSAVREGELTRWQARIVRSEGVIDEKSRVTYAVAQVDDPYRLHGDGTPLPVGTFVAASIDGTAPMDVIRIPRGALRGRDQVLIVDAESRIEIRTVNVIRTDEQFAYLGGGVQAGERITTTAIEAPTNGMSVRTVENGQPRGNGGDERVASRIEEEN